MAGGIGLGLEIIASQAEKLPEITAQDYVSFARLFLLSTILGGALGNKAGNLLETIIEHYKPTFFYR